jgi:hypothetical protein
VSTREQVRVSASSANATTLSHDPEHERAAADLALRERAGGVRRMS